MIDPHQVKADADQVIAETERWLHLSAVAKRVGVRRRTVLRWIKSEKISAARTLGGHYRIEAGEVERLEHLMSQK